MSSQPQRRTEAEMEPPPPPPDELALAAERARLQGLIAAARRRTAIAKMRTATLEAASREALRAEIEAVRQLLATMQREHDSDIAELRETAATDAARIVNDARRRVLHASGGTSWSIEADRVSGRVD